MKQRNLFVFFALLALLSSCKKKEEPVSERSKLLVANRWVLNQLTDAGGQRIDKSKLDLQTRVLFELEFEFRSNNQVTAADRTTKQRINGGTWQLVDNETAIDVDIVQLKDKFGLSEISRTKMTLTKKIPVSGSQIDANMEFVPVL